MVANKVPVHLVGTEGARPYGMGGNVPAGATVTARHPNGQGRLAEFSGRPYVPPSELPYNERPLCTALRKDGQPCKGKAAHGKEVCTSHDRG